jgi:tetratricopeptide (TPR) repeat protein
MANNSAEREDLTRSREGREGRGRFLISYRRALFLLLCLICCASLHAAVPPEFEAANQRYDKGDFQGARTAYEALVKTGNYSANLFYNLGNADYRLGKKGDAFVAYERALALDPAHPETRANLALLRDETGARLPSPPWTERAILWPETVTLHRAAWVAAVAFWALCFSFVPALSKSQAEGGRRPAWLPAIASVLVLAWCAGAIAWERTRGATWIVKEPQASARVSPADGSELAAALPMGSQVQLLQDHGPWLYVVLPDQNGESRGWISRTAVEPVIPARL